MAPTNNGEVAVNLLAQVENVATRLANIRGMLHEAEYKLNGPRPSAVSGTAQQAKAPESMREWLREIITAVGDIESVASEIAHGVGHLPAPVATSSGTAPITLSGRH